LDYSLAKLLWPALQPSNLLLLLLAAAVLLGWRRLAVSVLAILALAVVLPVGSWLTVPLEERFPRPGTTPERVTGVIVLGGAQQPHITASRGVLALNQHGERLIEGLALARRHPEARLLFSGWSARPDEQGTSEQLVNTVFIDLMDFDEDRVIREERSRNTWENALYTRDLIEPDAEDVWLLVTSASHMPRSIGMFRTVGLDLVPWPVDYQTARPLRWSGRFSVAGRLDDLDFATREWLALLFYHLRGRTDALFPGP
jgi:uncharacterized SAM-binding protein YcdF (DUF218 family)